MARVLYSIIFTALALAMVGCSLKGASTDVLTSAAPAQSMSGSSPDALHVHIKEFADLPKYGTGSANYYPGPIAAGPDGLLWVVDSIDQDFGATAIVGIETSGKAKHEYISRNNYIDYLDITAGPDGALWLTDGYQGQITRLTTSGSLTNYSVENERPSHIAAGPDRALWFTAASGSAGAIGRIATNGKKKFYPLSAQADDIAAGPGNALWFTERYPSGIGRITTNGKITTYTAGLTGMPDAIALGTDGALWFTESGPKIGRIATTGKITEYSQGISRPFILDIAAGPDGAMWFTENTFGQSYSPKIGRISADGHITEYSKGLPPKAGPTGIVQGPDKRMWFTDAYNDLTGRLTP